MKLSAFLFAFLLLATEAQASICQGAHSNASFGASFYKGATLTSFLYDTDYDTLYVTLPNKTWIAYQNVPYSVAYQFAATLAPDALYAQQILPIYKAAVETNNCLQLATANGTILVVN